MKRTTYYSLLLAASLLPAAAQQLSLDFTDSGWTNDRTGLSSEFQSNGAGQGNESGWQNTHSIQNVSKSGIGATLALSHEPHAWNIENRPSLAPYFPSNGGAAGDILRVWNDTAKIPNGEIPHLTLTFTESVKLYELGLEGFRHDDAWLVQAYDEKGNLVTPQWKDLDSSMAFTKPGDELADVAVNLLTTEGANGAEAQSAARYSSAEKGYVVWNQNNVFQRGAAVLNYNGAVVKSVKYSMLEVNTSKGTFTGDPSDQSMYIGSGIVFTQVPEPSSSSLIALGLATLFFRRKR